MINVFPNPLKYVEQKGQFSFQDRVVLTIGKSFSNQWCDEIIVVI